MNMTAVSMPRAIEFFLQRGPATMDQIKIVARNVKSDATEKQIYNACSSLVRAGKLTRLGYGQYVISPRRRQFLDCGHGRSPVTLPRITALMTTDAD